MNLPRMQTLCLSAVVPAYNEAAHLERFVRALCDTLAGMAPVFEVIVVDDGSADATAGLARALAKLLPVRYLRLSRNFGKEAALSAGIDHARGDVVLLIDADFQHPLEQIGPMVELWRAGADMVYGVIADRSNEGLLKRLGTNAFYRLMSQNSAVQIPRDAGDFRLMDRCVVRALQAMPERNRFMKGMYAWVGFQTVALPFTPAARAGGTSSFNLRRLTALALDGLTSFSTLPLQAVALTGLCISALAMVYGAWIIASAWVWGNSVQGWPTLAAGLMLFSGLQLLSIGVVGAYIGRIYDEVKQRPVYLVAEDHDGSPLRTRSR
jgi:glycosyltransferase involved in cell wall biosynthesis